MIPQHPWDLYPAFRRRLAELILGAERLLVACSGGPDSMALLDLLSRWRRETGGFLCVAHVDHGLRGRASGVDAAFVRREARRRGTKYRITRVSVQAWRRRHGGGVEETARLLRYRALTRLARTERCRHVLTAHQLDDQVETIFMNLIRGTGPAGLSGMSPVTELRETRPLPHGFRGDGRRPGAGKPGQKWLNSANPRTLPGLGPAPLLVRPLLSVPRSEIITYLKHRAVRYRTDASNFSSAFFRNRVRPVLRRWDRARPGFFQRAARLANMLRDEEAFWAARLRPAVRRLVRRRRNGAVIDLHRLIRYHKVEQRRIFRHIFPALDYAALERIRFFALSPDRGPLSLPSGGCLQKMGRALIMRPHGLPSSEHFQSAAAPLSMPGQVSVLVAGKPSTPAGLNGDHQTIWIRTRRIKKLPRAWRRFRPDRMFADADRLGASPLVCRSWRAGDRFQPLGMRGHKKLQDFFIDACVPREQRRGALVLEHKDGIVWVLGHRMADWVKLTPRTRRIVEFRVTSGNGPPA